MDATGRFPAISTKGNQYILVMISEGTNYIKCIPIPSRTKHSYLKAHQEALQFYEEHGCKPTFQRMDNETSNAFMEHLRTNKITIDLVPPHQHRRNKAERAIQTFKNHFVAALAGVDPNFPMTAWDEIMEQVEITLNMLRPSNLAYTHAHQHGKPYTESMTGKHIQWHQSVQLSPSMKNPDNATHGASTASKAST
jgi:hypothetical protein